MEAWQRPGGSSGDDVCHTIRPRQCDLPMYGWGGRWMGCARAKQHPNMAHMNKAAAANILAALEPIRAQ
jgi:hypothetical protein